MIISTEATRKEQAIRYVREWIDELNRPDLHSEYFKDPATGIIYYPNCHPDEVRRAECEKQRWQALLAILTNDLPFDLQSDTDMRRDA